MSEKCFMSNTTKSLKEVLQTAKEVSTAVLPPYCHEYSPKKYTQPQLFCCLIVKAFLSLDYRGTSAFIKDFSEVRELIGLNCAPHYATLQRACQRLLQEAPVLKILEETLELYDLKKTVEV